MAGVDAKEEDNKGCGDRITPSDGLLWTRGVQDQLYLAEQESTPGQRNRLTSQDRGVGCCRIWTAG